MWIDVKTNTVLYNFSTRFGNSVSKVIIYPETSKKISAEQPLNTELINSTQCAKSKPGLNLVVVNTIHPAVIFQ